MLETFLFVANQLESRIHDLDEGARVPSENEVVREFSVSRPTARAALQELERRFVVRRIKGSGTYVNRRIPYPIGSAFPVSASQTLAANGHQSSMRVVTVSETELSPQEALAFLPDTPQRLCVVGRIMEVEEEPVGFGFSKISCSAAPGFQRHINDITSIWRILDSIFHIRLRRRTASVSLDTPPVQVAKILGTREPTWHLQSVNVNEMSGAVVEIAESWLRTDRMAVTVHFESHALVEPPASTTSAPTDLFRQRTP